MAGVTQPFIVMAKYIIEKPWSFTVKEGDVIETDNLHPSLAAHVRKLPEQDSGKLEVATPSRRGRQRQDDSEE